MSFLNLPIATEDGRFVSRKHQRIAEIIADYDQDLRLVYIPENDRSEDKTEKPFAIYDIVKKYFVLHADEAEVDNGQILTRLFLADNTQVSAVRRLEAIDAARLAIEYKERLEAIEHAEDVARTLSRRSFS